MCLTHPSLQHDFDDDGTLKTVNDNIDNIHRDLQKAKQNKKVYMMSLNGVVEIGWH